MYKKDKNKKRDTLRMYQKETKKRGEEMGRKKKVHVNIYVYKKKKKKKHAVRG